MHLPFWKSIFKKICEQGLKQVYLENVDYKVWFKTEYCLAFIPIDQIDSQFEILQYKYGVMDIGLKGLKIVDIDSYSSYSKKKHKSSESLAASRTSILQISPVKRFCVTNLFTSLLTSRSCIPCANLFITLGSHLPTVLLLQLLSAPSFRHTEPTVPRKITQKIRLGAVLSTRISRELSRILARVY